MLNVSDTGGFVPPEPLRPWPPYHFKDAPRWIQVAVVLCLIALEILAIFLSR
jgi:hypothetical protein